MPIEQAIFEVLEANAKAREITPTKRLVERMDAGDETIADLLLKMPNTDVSLTSERRVWLRVLGSCDRLRGRGNSPGSPMEMVKGLWSRQK